MNPTHPNDPKKEAGSKKTPLQLLPPYALAQTALAHAEGAKKYGPWNWRTNQVCATTYIGAILRHLTAWQDGEDIDADSGLSHIAKIGACCNILLDAGHCGTLVDDRSKVPSKPSKALQDFADEERRRFIRECRDVDTLLQIPEAASQIPEVTPPPITPPPGYRMLNLGETIQQGDEFFDGFGWKSSLCFGEIYARGGLLTHHPHTRKIESEIPSGLPPLPPVPGVTPSHPPTPCCNYEAELSNAYPVFWNPFNSVVQCHNCGHQYEAVK